VGIRDTSVHKLDAEDGFYFTSAFTLAKANFPLSVSAIINKTIEYSCKPFEQGNKRKHR
jgi:hypothetical protein